MACGLRPPGSPSNDVNSFFTGSCGEEYSTSALITGKCLHTDVHYTGSFKKNAVTITRTSSQVPLVFQHDTGRSAAAGGGHGGSTITAAAGASSAAGALATGASAAGFGGLGADVTAGRRCSMTANCRRYSERFSRQATYSNDGTRAYLTPRASNYVA